MQTPDMIKKYALSIVIPTYKSAQTIGRLVDELVQLPVEGGLEIVLVNDGSSDNTACICEELIRKYSVPITLINHSRNFGEHNAVMTGLRHARGEYVITMDDDLQNPPGEVLKLFNYTRQGSYDVVYAYFKEKKHSAWRNCGSWLTNRMADVLLDKPKGLYLSTFRCMNAFLVERTCDYAGPFPYVDGLIIQITQQIGRIEVAHFERQESASSYTIRKLVRLWLSMFVNFSIMPLRISTIAGIVLFISGMLGVVGTVADYMLLGGTPSGWAQLMCSIFLFSGIQMFILGIVGEYLGRLYLTANRKPQSVVRNIIKNN
jgi:undecaprenyl-phosphate 4-deoxy-4-formamido-L-arabinose transferase